MSRNEERLMEVLQEQISEEKTQEASKRNSLLEFLSKPVLTEVVDLPSGGVLYPINSPLFGRESIEIKYPTTKEQEILNSRSLQKKNLAIDKMLESLFVDSDVKAKDILVGDKNAILIRVRELMFGRQYNLRMICPICANIDEDFFFDLEDATTKSVLSEDELKEVGASFVRDAAGNPFYEITLPETGFKTLIKLATGSDETSILSTSERKRKNKLEETPMKDQLMLVIHSVDGFSSLELKNDFISKAPTSDMNYIMKMYRELEPTMALKTNYACSICFNVSEDVEVPITVKFFRP